MTPDPPWGARPALWWVAAYTATAPAEDAADRRAEVAADVADELRCSGISAATSRRMAGRVLRGVAADMLWRLSAERAPGRAAWHLAHPVTLIGTLSALLVPLVLVGDALRSLSRGSAGRLLDLVHAWVVLLSAAVLAVVITALIRRRVDPPPGRRERGALLLADGVRASRCACSGRRPASGGSPPARGRGWQRARGRHSPPAGWSGSSSPRSCRWRPGGGASIANDLGKVLPNLG